MDFFGDWDFGSGSDDSILGGLGITDWSNTGGDSGGGLFDSTNGLGYSGLFDFDASQGVGAGSGSDTSGIWGALLGAGMNAASGYAKNKASEKMSKKEFERAKEMYTYKLNEDQRMKDLNNKATADALKGYAQYFNYNPNTFAAVGNAPSPFNPSMVSSYGQPQGILNYGY